VPDAALHFVYELANYDFSEQLGVDVLGRVFERSIVDIEALHAEIDKDGSEPSAARKARSKRSQDGVFYTPEWVTHFLAEQSLGAWLVTRFTDLRDQSGVDRIPAAHRQKKHSAEVAFWEAYQHDLRTVKVLDPACGSGAFLVAAYDTLLSEYDRTNRTLAELRGGQPSLFDPGKEILEGNLYGVDINGESVEISRLSLWLKTAKPGRPLTALDQTIQRGNSLVEPPAETANEEDRALFRALPPNEQAEALDWHAAFPEVFSASERPDGRIGFDVVLGNPPYVRGEWLSPTLKDLLECRYTVFGRKADLLVYFFERSLGVLAKGGRLGFIVSNKWLKAAYGEPLRRFLSRNAVLESLIDFGHSPVFEDADTFPVITLLSRPDEAAQSTTQVRLAKVPRESLGAAGLAQLVESGAIRVDRDRFGDNAWSLEPPQVHDLINEISQRHPSLRDSLDKRCMSGVKTGYNDAFLLDAETRDRLIEQHPGGAEVIRSFARGSDIGRWSVEPPAEYLVAIPSSRDRTWPWTGAAEPEAVFAATYPSIYEHFRTDQRPSEDRLGRMMKRQDQGEHWWELRSCSYYKEFEKPKVMFADIAWQPEVALDGTGLYLNNTAYFLPGRDLWALAVLNSPVMWWLAWRTFQHGKDEALRWFADSVETVPFPQPTERQLDDVCRDVEALIREYQVRSSDRLDFATWLRVEHNVVEPGRHLLNAGSLGLDDFLSEMRTRGGHERLSPGLVTELSAVHQDAVASTIRQESLVHALECSIADVVEEAYGLDEWQRQLIRETAPPRTPLY
jgi:hypothetical protein